MDVLHEELRFDEIFEELRGFIFVEDEVLLNENNALQDENKNQTAESQKSFTRKGKKLQFFNEKVYYEVVSSAKDPSNNIFR